MLSESQQVAGLHRTTVAAVWHWSSVVPSVCAVPVRCWEADPAGCFRLISPKSFLLLTEAHERRPPRGRIRLLRRCNANKKTVIQSFSQTVNSRQTPAGTAESPPHPTPPRPLDNKCYQFKWLMKAICASPRLLRSESICSGSLRWKTLSV